MAQTKKDKAIQIKYKSKKISQKELDGMIRELDYDPNCEPVKGWYVQTLQEDKKGNLCLCRYCANGSHSSGKGCLHCEGTGIQKHTWTSAEYNRKKKSYDHMRNNNMTKVNKDKRYQTFGKV